MRPASYFYSLPATVTLISTLRRTDKVFKRETNQEPSMQLFFIH